MQTAVIVIPCFNEEHRLQLDLFTAMLDHDPALSLLFVNDGSTDATLARLNAFKHDRAHVLSLTTNAGKAEAVRRGLRHAITLSPDIVAFLDADLATPVPEVQRLLDLFRNSEHNVLLASRIQYLGTNIERKMWRHYLGRVFATFASNLLRLPVYDTQCGLKFFRITPRLTEALANPFETRWLFDVEILGRLITRRGNLNTNPLPISSIREIPILNWRDVRGSKIGPAACLGAVVGLIRLAFRFHLSRNPLRQ